MKNPLEKNNHTELIVVLAAAAVTAGTLAYLYLTESGADTREAIKHKLKDEAKDLAAGFVSKKTGISKKHTRKAADILVK